MNITKKLLNKYNTPDTLAILSSFPKKDGEVADENAVARYTNLLITNFVGSRKIVVICEKRQKTDKAYELADNILVVPSYKVNSLLFSFQVIKTLYKFNQIKNLLIQFEFSIFGGKDSLPGLLGIIFSQWLFGRNISITLHQVVDDISSLSGHLGLKRGSLRTHAFNFLLSQFYKLIGIFSDTVIVHDSLLKTRLSAFVKEDKIVVIPHGGFGSSQLSSSLRSRVRRSLGFDKKDFVILVFGYQSWYKGTDWIIKTVGDLVEKHPELNLKILLAGGESPTLKYTSAYKNFFLNLKDLLGHYGNIVKSTGFVPESEVAKVFAASDAVVFPYRTRMSASGALSLTWSYGKAFLASSQFATNFLEPDVLDAFARYSISTKDISFELNLQSFEKVLIGLVNNKSLTLRLKNAGAEVANFRTWSRVAKAYELACTRQAISVSIEDSDDLSYV